MADILVLLSGGMDSAVLLASYRTAGKKCHAVSFDYGQRHLIELMSAGSLAEYYESERTVLDLSSASAVFAGSSQTSPGIPVPEGHYAEESMKKTVVPNRNMVMLAMAGALAVSKGIPAVAYAAHAGDHAIYPDCRPDFFEAMASAFSRCDWNPPRLLAPFIGMTKAQICSLGAGLRIPFGLTYSCYKGGPRHCGKCGTCVERREAFQLAGVLDTTIYEGS